MSDLTEILNRANSGEDTEAAKKATEKAVEAVYKQLHQIAEAKMRHQSPRHTLQATVLVHDAWLRLCPSDSSPQFKSRAHFFAAAATVMRRILIDHARHNLAKKHGKQVELSETKIAELVQKAPGDLILAVDEALTTFSKTGEATAKLIELRFFVGLSMKEAAEALEIPLRTAERDYAYFKAWFQREFGKDINTEAS